MIGRKLPNVTFRTRVRDESIEGPNPFKWENKTTDDYFKGKKVVLFSLPGAFTPTCSSTHLPGYEAAYEQFKDEGVDEVYCLSVNDAFTMYQWGQHQGVEKVKLLPDGSGDFTTIGDAVAAVAAETPEIAQEAVDLIEVEYEELTPVFDGDEAFSRNPPAVLHEDLKNYETLRSVPPRYDENRPN